MPVVNPPTWGAPTVTSNAGNARVEPQGATRDVVEMLDMGFAEDIEMILDRTPDERQTVLFSATMPRRIETIARRHLRDPVRIELGREPSAASDETLIEQTAYIVPRAHKAAALGRLLDVEAPTAALVFCRTREQVEQLSSTLNGCGYRTEALHGGMTSSSATGSWRGCGADRSTSSSRPTSPLAGSTSSS